MHKKPLKKAAKKSRPARKPRSDAQENRMRILEAAKEAFTQHGAQASLDEIAKQAGVGAGTLYRHFPSREELLKEVYRTEMEKLADAEHRLAAELAPVEALRAWLLLFVEAIAAKQVIAPALKELLGNPKEVFEASYVRLREALHSLVARAVRSGELRPDVEPNDLLRALIGVAYVDAGPDWQASARRLVDLLIAGGRR
jgi:AcrR family transcriptional regulator